jgi:hypothetical protein
VKSISVTAFDVIVMMTNGVAVEVRRFDPRLMEILEQAVSSARRQAPPPRLRPLRPSESDTEGSTDLDV